MLALRPMQVPHIHRFSSDVVVYVRRQLEANVDAGTIMYKDVHQRDTAKVPAVDLCGGVALPAVFVRWKATSTHGPSKICARGVC